MPVICNKSISVVIPTYNESRRLPQTLEEIHPYLQDRFPEHEIVVVDDNSPDRTADAVRKFSETIPNINLIVQPFRIGKGASVRRGMLEAKGDYVLFMDADHATPIQELDKFIPLIEQNNEGVVVGVRTYQANESRWRRVLGLVAQLLAHIIVFRKAVVDSQCGFKLFTRNTVKSLIPFCRVNGGMLDVELFFLMQIFDIPCQYYPVHWCNKPGSTINILRCMIIDTIELFRIPVRHWFGVYRKPLTDDKQPWANPGKASQLSR